MNAEELIKYLKKCIDDLDIQDFEAIITQLSMTLPNYKMMYHLLLWKM